MSRSKEILRKSIIFLLRPVVRFAIKNSFKFRDISECLKNVYLSLSKEELEKLGGEITISKLSAMSGLQRVVIRQGCYRYIIILDSGRVPPNEILRPFKRLSWFHWRAPWEKGLTSCSWSKH